MVFTAESVGAGTMAIVSPLLPHALSVSMAAAAAAAIIFFICTPFCPPGRTSLPSAQKILFLVIAII